MFTGIINGQGDIVRVETRGRETRLTIQALFPLERLVVGESIAVNGACLTVEHGEHGRFAAYVSAESMGRTTLGQLVSGSRVNLERALAMGDRLGGHLVSGHVDCVATVESVRQEGESRRIRMRFPQTFAQEVITKGSVALDGISLTVNDCGDTFLNVNIIPETWRVTTASCWTTGASVNMETDVIGKYVRRMLQPVLGTASASADTAKSEQLSEDFLRSHGFL